MGTLQTVVTRALVAVRDVDQTLDEFSDTNLLGMTNIILNEVHDDLSNADSNMIYTIGSVTTVDGTAEYTPSFTDFQFINYDAVWVDGEKYFLSQLDEEEKINYDVTTTTATPTSYYVTEGGDIGFLPTPDDAYTIYFKYTDTPTELTSVSSDDLPYEGIFNNAIYYKLVADMLEIQERDNSRYLVQYVNAYKRAKNKVYKRGTKKRYQKTTFFDRM